MRHPSASTVWLWAAAFCALTTMAAAQTGEWRNYSGDAGHRKYSPLDQINKDNVKNLRVVWRRPAVDPQFSSRDPKLRVPNNFRASPLMIGGVLYSPNGIGLVEAFDPGSGKTLWVQEYPVGSQGLSGDSTRGLAVLARPQRREAFCAARRHARRAQCEDWPPIRGLRPVWNRRPELRSGTEN